MNNQSVPGQGQNGILDSESIQTWSDYVHINLNGEKHPLQKFQKDLLKSIVGCGMPYIIAHDRYVGVTTALGIYAAWELNKDPKRQILIIAKTKKLGEKLKSIIEDFSTTENPSIEVYNSEQNIYHYVFSSKIINPLILWEQAHLFSEQKAKEILFLVEQQYLKLIVSGGLWGQRWFQQLFDETDIACYTQYISKFDTDIEPWFGWEKEDIREHDALLELECKSGTSYEKTDGFRRSGSSFQEENNLYYGNELIAYGLKIKNKTRFINMLKAFNQYIGRYNPDHIEQAIHNKPMAHGEDFVLPKVNSI